MQSLLRTLNDENSKKAVTIVFKSWSTAKYFLKSQSGEGWALRGRELPVFRAPRKSVKVLNGHWKQIVEREREGGRGKSFHLRYFLFFDHFPVYKMFVTKASPFLRMVLYDTIKYEWEIIQRITTIPFTTIGYFETK